jgi:hypothetical protein
MYGFLRKGVYFDQADGGGSATGDSLTDTDDSAGANGNGDQAKTDADKAGGDKDKGKQAAAKVTFTEEQQAAVDLIVKERLEREHKKSEAAAEKVRKQAEEEALTKNKEFETLAEQRKIKVDELEAQVSELAPLKEQVEKYKGAMETILKAQMAKLPKALLPLLEKLDPIEKMQYLADHAKELNVEVIGVPETDTNDSTHKLNEEAQAKAKQQNARVVKSLFSG